MSPEQVRGETLTEKSDLFSLGVVVCELFTGTNPFLGKDINATFNAIVGFHEDEQFPDLTGVPAEAVFLIRHLLHQVPAARSLSIAESGSKQNAPQKKAGWLLAGRIRKKYILPLMVVCLLFVAGAVFALIKNANSGSSLALNGIAQTGDRTGIIAAKEENNSRGASDDKSKTSELPNKVTEQEKAEPGAKTLQQQPAVSPVQGTGKLFIECTPWAYVYIDSVQVETTPLKNDLVLPAGPHLLRLLHPTFPQYASRIQVQPGQTNSIRINMDTLFGFLDCKVNPWGQIYVDGKMIGETPFQSPIKIIPGEHSVIVKNTNYPQAEYRVKIEQNKVFTLKYSFTRSIQGKEN
jgi:serine/threonine-protein kinase